MPAWRKILAGLAFFTAAAILAYWLLFFLAPRVVRTERPDPATYMAFETAFLLADVVVASLFAATGVGLVKKWPWVLASGSAAGGGLLFLGAVDLLYDLLQGVFSPFGLPQTLELAVVSYSLALGGLLPGYLWSRRYELLPPQEVIRAR